MSGSFYTTWEHYNTHLSTHYVEKRFSPVETIAQDSSRASREYWVPWAERIQAIKDFLGSSEVRIASTGARYISRIPPHMHPHYPGMLYAESFQNIKGFMPEDGPDVEDVAIFETAELTCNYTSPMYTIMDDIDLLEQQALMGWPQLYPDEATLLRYVTVDVRPAAKFQTIPSNASLKWLPDQVPMANQAAVLLPEADIIIQWVQVPMSAIPWTAISDCMGKTNGDWFGSDVLTIGVCQPETLVMGAPDIKTIRRPNGTFAANVAYKFRRYPHGANFFYRWDQKAAGFKEATRNGKPSGTPMPDGSDNRLFPPADYNALFRPEP